VVYGDNIATFVKGKGVTVINLQRASDIKQEDKDKLMQYIAKGGKKISERIVGKTNC